VENDFHLFFHCNLPRAVWFTSNPSIRVDTLAPEDDGVQYTLSTLISANTTNEILCRILITLWYLWKARNDNRFHRKNWTPWQVHHAILAYITAQHQALQEAITNTNVPAHDMTQRPNMNCQFTAHAQAANLDHTTDGTHYMNAGTMVQQMDRFTLQVPALLPATRCFVDASTTPDHPSHSTRKAGIGILFVNTQVQPVQTIYIKASMSITHSVIMAEAAVLALATVLADHLNFTQISFLSDCSQLGTV
jgi:hypothetical protein